MSSWDTRRHLPAARAATRDSLFQMETELLAKGVALALLVVLLLPHVIRCATALTSAGGARGVRAPPVQAG